ncbi:MAG TPA: hypothetical protein ENI60_05940 [Candidatus Fraserbacteria bacterium]|nr:hypothetical protein [Candidatus Fraserbacteria bacterium]
MKRVLGRWWPLAASWMLMGAELPLVSAVIARLAHPEINLAAYGGVVFPLALLIESPIIMLLAASTALSRDWRSYLALRRFMMGAGLALTAFHALLVYTPLYYVVVRGLLGAPAEIVEPARLGLMIMIPWSWAIAYRRFNQGILIRFNHARAVSAGTLIRLSVLVTALTLGYWQGSLPGVVVGTGAVIAGILSEALYIGLRVQPVIRDQLQSAVARRSPLAPRAFARFYVPLALTSLLGLLIQPLGSAALSRMPHALESLAVWPVVGGLLFLLRSLGFAYQEVVVALLDEPQTLESLRRFALILAAATTALLLLIAATPLATVWFEGLSGLSPALARLAQTGLWIGFLMPALSTLQNWYQGLIVHSRRTRGITESIVIALAVTVGLLWAGVTWGTFPGLYVGLAAFVSGNLIQVLWLWQRSRPVWQGAQL